MAKRYVDVYEDTKSSGNSILVRDDGDATAIFGNGLGRWRRNAKIYAWVDGERAETLKSACGDLIGRVEYDDGAPESCAPSY